MSSGRPMQCFSDSGHCVTHRLLDEVLVAIVSPALFLTRLGKYLRREGYQHILAAVLQLLHLACANLEMRVSRCSLSKDLRRKGCPCAFTSTLILVQGAWLPAHFILVFPMSIWRWTTFPFFSCWVLPCWTRNSVESGFGRHRSRTLTSTREPYLSVDVSGPSALLGNPRVPVLVLMETSKKSEGPKFEGRRSHCMDDVALVTAHQTITGLVALTSFPCVSLRGSGEGL